MTKLWRIGKRGCGERKSKILKLQVYTSPFSMCVSKVVLYLIMSVLNGFADLVKSDVLCLENGPSTKLHSKYFQYFRNVYSTSKPRANVSVSHCNNTDKIYVLGVVIYFSRLCMLKGVFLQFPLFLLHCKIGSYLITCWHCSSVATFLCGIRCWFPLILCTKKYYVLLADLLKNMFILRQYFIS